jgi:CheY-like chemotaxis protein
MTLSLTPLMSKCILVIDDEKHLGFVIQTCLSKLGGWTVTLAHSGREGLQAAAATQPDAILLDIMMPDLDGLTVVERLRADPATTTIPVILLTAKMQPLQQDDCTRLGIAGVLAKPFEPLNLATQVAELLRW